MLPKDLSPYRLDLVLIRETAQRIIKDFESFGINISFSGNFTTAYDELSEQLIKIIDNLIYTDKPKLMRVLYKIDISEQKIKDMVKQFPASGLQEIITQLVIERELQKVITNKYFNQKKNSSD